jgi:multiple sugar transport system substrate-binding protein
LVIVILVGVLGFYLFRFLRERFFPARQDVTLSYWGIWEDADIVNPLLTDFISSYTDEHPNISLTVNYEKRSFGTLKQYKDTLLTRLERGQAPDVFRIHNSWVEEFSPKLSSLPSAVMSEEIYGDSFYPVALSSAKVGGSLYAIPLEYDGLVLFYNKKLFEGVDVAANLSTWEGFRREAVRLTQWEGNDPSQKILRAGAAFGASENVSHSADLLSLVMSQSGINPLSDLGTQTAEDALSFYVNFVEEDHIWDESLSPSIEAFANGKVAMVFGPSWRALNIRDLNPQLDFAAVPVPQFSGQEKEIHWATFWMEAVNKDSENTEIAWELLRFLAEGQQQQKFYAAASKVRYFGEPYSRPSLANELETHAILGAVLADAASAVSGKIIDYSGNDAYASAFNEAISNVLGGWKIEAALETAQATLNQLEGVSPPEED